MRIRKITANDVCAVTGYTRHQLRGLLDNFSVYSQQKTLPRVAREFTSADLIILAVVHELEARYSIRRDFISSISEPLSKTLTGPKMVNRDARLLITFDPPAVEYLTSASQIEDGILVSLRRIFQRVDEYLGQGLPYREESDPELPLGPGLVAGVQKKITP